MAARAVALDHEVIGTTSKTLDIRSRTDVLDLLLSVRPRVVVNAAATMSDWSVTADGAAYVALAAKRVGARLLHMSTDVVHGGRPEPYTEMDLPSPIGAYGAAKAAAETAIAAIDPFATMVRTSLIVGPDSKHARMALEMITGKRAGVLFTDEIRCPIDVADLAAAVLELADSDHVGLLNVAGPEAISRADYGRLLARRSGLDPADVPTGALAEAGLGPRAAEVRLDISKAQSLLKTELRPVSETLS